MNYFLYLRLSKAALIQVGNKRDIPDTPVWEYHLHTIQWL